jgi:ABC-2 type transport system ATP-binding protein
MGGTDPDAIHARRTAPAPPGDVAHTPPILSVEDVHKSFGAVKAVAGVTVAAAPGEVVALLGPNGAGKTTLLRMVIGMLAPDRGRIRYGLDGRLLDRPDPERIGYLPEERGLYLDVPVRRLLLYFAALRGMPRDAARAESERWLERFDLGNRGGEELRNLSKGNQQKVQFISAILHRPALAVLDEPFSGLDPLNQDFFLELIRELSDAGTAVVLSAHQMQLVERIADRIVLIRRGRAVTQGTVAELREQWGTGKRLRLRVVGEPDAAFLAAQPGVREVTRHADGAIAILLDPEEPMSGLLEAAGRRLDVRDISTESVTLHDIYVQTVGAAEPAAREVEA